MKRIIASLMLLMGMVLTPALSAAAQPETADQTWVSELTGDEIDLGTSGDIQFIPENFEMNETTSFQEEFIWFTYGWSNFEMILISGPTTTAEYHDLTLGNMFDFYDSFEVIDEEVTEDHSFFLGEAEYQGSPLVVYYEFELDAHGDIDQVIMQFTDASTFAADLEFVQTEVTFAGDPLLPNTDAQALAGLVGGATEGTTPESDDDEATGRTSRSSNTDDDEDADSGTTSRTSRSSGTSDTDEEDDDTGVTGRTSRTSGTDDDDVSTPDADDEEDTTGRSGNSSEVNGDEDDTETTGRSSRTSSTDVDEDQPDRESRTGRVSDSDDDDEDVTSTPAGGDWESMGLVSDSEWESPTFGVVITWDTVSWEFPQDFESAIYISEDSSYDVVTLQTTDGMGYVYMTVEEQGNNTPRSLADFWTTPEYADRFEQGITVVDTASTANTASVMYETTNTRDQSLFVVVEATFLDDGTVVYSQISAAPDTIADVYGQFGDGVEIDGASIDLTWTIEDVLDLSGN